MKYIIGLIVCNIIASTTIIAQDYKSDKLFTVYGESFYKGETDSKATVEINSVNNKLQFIISVIDDSVIISDDWRNSDHVEIWFNMDADSNDYFVYNNEFYGGGKITNEQREPFRNYLLSQTKGNDSLIRDIQKAELPIVKEINGMTHWAFNLKDSTAFLYDTEYYLKLPLVNTDYLKNKIKIHPAITSTGYKVIIEFDPSALIFLRKNSNKEITFMADIFDVDGSDKNLSVLSTVKNRKWGAPERFNHISIKKPISITGTKVLKELQKSFTFYRYEPNHKWSLYRREVIKRKPQDLYYTFKYIKVN